MDPVRPSEWPTMPADHALACDVLVAGGGSAGTAAAIAAARRGLRVILAEESNCLGGTSTTGGVSEWFARLEGLGDIFELIKAQLDRFGARSERFFNIEYLKIAWQLAAEQAGVQLLLHASVFAVQAEAGRVSRARIISLGRAIDVTAGYFVDATGEGDLAAAAGAELMKGHPQTGDTLHMSLTAMMFDTGKPVTPYLPPPLEPIESDADLPGLLGHVPFPHGRVYLNMTKVIGCDPTDPLALSQAECEARRQLVRVVHYLNRTRYPNHMLSSSGARIGVREGRRIVGDYIIREQDAVPGGTDFDDGVAVATCQIDFHSLTKPGPVGWRRKVEPYALPLRAMIAKGFANLLMAGKCISGEQVAHSSYRMTPTCVAMGQAVGTAVAMAHAARRDDIHNLDVPGLRQQLRGDGMELDPKKHQPFAPQITDRREDAE